jgi:hypothetical protein
MSNVSPHDAVRHMLKMIHFLGALLAMGLMWFFAAVAIVQWVAPTLLSDAMLAGLLALCFALAVYPAWKLFVQRSP